jgi:hypothetical protein
VPGAAQVLNSATQHVLVRGQSASLWQRVTPGHEAAAQAAEPMNPQHVWPAWQSSGPSQCWVYWPPVQASPQNGEPPIGWQQTWVPVQVMPPQAIEPMESQAAADDSATHMLLLQQ